MSDIIPPPIANVDVSPIAWAQQMDPLHLNRSARQRAPRSKANRRRSSPAWINRSVAYSERWIG